MQESNTDSHGNNSCEETTVVAAEKVKKSLIEKGDLNKAITLLNQKVDFLETEYLTSVKKDTKEILTLLKEKSNNLSEKIELSEDSQKLLGTKKKRSNAMNKKITTNEVKEISEEVKILTDDENKKETKKRGKGRPKHENLKSGKKEKEISLIEEDVEKIEEVKINDEKKEITEEVNQIIDDEESKSKEEKKLKKEEEIKKPEEKIEEKKSETNEIIMNYENHILNKKKIQWEVNVKKAKNWICLGIAQRKKEKDNIEPMEITIKKENKNSVHFYGIDNEKNNYSFENGKIVETKNAKGIIQIKEGDNLVFIYNPKLNQLKITKNKFTFAIDNIVFNNDEYLVPCAQIMDKNDKVAFKNYQILAEYNK